MTGPIRVIVRLDRDMPARLVDSIHGRFRGRPAFRIARPRGARSHQAHNGTFFDYSIKNRRLSRRKSRKETA